MMESHLVEFDNMEWIEVGEGIRFKCFEKSGKKIRLIDLKDTYSDTDWCTNGHSSYIVDGKFTVKFENHTENFNTGDTVFIAPGTRHIAMVDKGFSLKMISFEI
jgi:Cys-tRNA synthase (O-phospho-L-seryl-tRNA:Cys-tRNA synthase)